MRQFLVLDCKLPLRTPRTKNTVSPNGKRIGLVVSALVSGSSGQGSSPGQEHCVVFLGKTLYSHSAPLHPGVYNGYHAERNSGINPATNQHPIQGRVKILLVASCYGNRGTCLPDGPLGSYTDSS